MARRFNAMAPARIEAQDGDQCIYLQAGRYWLYTASSGAVVDLGTEPPRAWLTAAEKIAVATCRD